ncbi:FAD-binding protein [Streptomyces sp. NPDC006458]|uniref:FAD-binding oxidoreductase n=1 Tax=Streptomyces sp. NPDC006458 TaxID=3154302 RepID=UPI0033A10717
MINRRSFLVGAGGTALAATALSGFTTARASGVKWDQLSRYLKGRLVLPSDDDYQRAKQLYQVQFDTTSPRGVVYAACASDVALALRFAQDNALPVAARSGGHSAGGFSTTPGLVIDVSRLNGISVGSESTRIGAGAQLVDVTNTLAPQGLTISGGYCPTVAVGGFLQGGGFGLFTRSIGMASDKVKSARVVLANGRCVTASPQEHSDLFWALRGGGGGNFGIVTSYEVEPTPLTNLAVTALTWRYDQSLDMLDGWAKWLADAPWTIGSGLNVTLEDAAPGKVPVATVFLASVDLGPGFAPEVDRLVSLVGQAPLYKQAFTAPYQSVMMNLYRCADLTVSECHRGDTTEGGKVPRPAFGAWRSRLFSDAMPRDGWAQALSVLESDRIAGQARQLQVSALGGQVNTVSRTSTAYVHRDTLFSASFLTANVDSPVADEAKAAALRFVDNGFAALDPHSNGETYQNFIDPRLPDWKRSYYAENYPRLARTKGKYDPNNVFKFAQSIR